EAKIVIRCVLEALVTSHQKLIVHRDIKPDNCFLFSDNLADTKLGDFGICAEDNGFNCVGGIKGTKGYMAPEILKKQQYGRKVDIWSTGVLAYQLLFEYLPFPAAPAKTTMSLFQSKPKLTFPDMIPISSEGKDFISKLLADDPDNRPTASDALAHPWLFIPVPFPDPNRRSSLSPTVVTTRAISATAEYSYTPPQPLIPGVPSIPLRVLEEVPPQMENTHPIHHQLEQHNLQQPPTIVPEPVLGHEGWLKLVPQNGDPAYFFHKESGTTQWTPPTTILRPAPTLSPQKQHHVVEEDDDEDEEIPLTRRKKGVQFDSHKIVHVVTRNQSGDSFDAQTVDHIENVLETEGLGTTILTPPPMTNEEVISGRLEAEKQAQQSALAASRPPLPFPPMPPSQRPPIPLPVAVLRSDTISTTTSSPMTPLSREVSLWSAEDGVIKDVSDYKLVSENPLAHVHSVKAAIVEDSASLISGRAGSVWVEGDNVDGNIQGLNRVPTSGWVNENPLSHVHSVKATVVNDGVLMKDGRIGGIQGLGKLNEEALLRKKVRSTGSETSVIQDVSRFKSMKAQVVHNDGDEVEDIGDGGNVENVEYEDGFVVCDVPGSSGEGWRMVAVPANTVYYYNETTGTVQWASPVIGEESGIRGNRPPAPPAPLKRETKAKSLPSDETKPSTPKRPTNSAIVTSPKSPGVSKSNLQSDNDRVPYYMRATVASSSSSPPLARTTSKGLPSSPTIKKPSSFPSAKLSSPRVSKPSTPPSILSSGPGRALSAKNQVMSPTEDIASPAKDDVKKSPLTSSINSVKAARAALEAKIKSVGTSSNSSAS
ncbi:hypothetical protein HDU99_001882, partial [Rhizoclosmatium hyalinum]